MADKKISALTAATTPLAGTEVLPIVQSGTTVKASIANVQAAPVAAASANSVQYLNASKVPSTSANLFFNGTQLGVGGLTSPHCTVGVPNATFGANSNTVGCSFGIDTNALTQPFTGFRWTGASAGISGGGFVTQWVTDSVNSTHTEIYNTGATPIVLGVNSTPMFRVEATGDSRIFNGNLIVGTSGKGITDSTGATTLNFTSTAVTANAPVFSTLFKTANGTVSAPNNTATTFYTTPTLNNGTYIVSCNVAAGDPLNYSAVSLVTVDATVLRATALQTAALLSITISGQTIRGTQLSGSPANILWTVTRVS
jgi:hypothetical protein